MPKILFFSLALFAALFLLPAPASAQVQQCCLTSAGVRRPGQADIQFGSPTCVIAQNASECVVGQFPGNCSVVGRIGAICNFTKRELKPCSENNSACRAVLIETLANCPNLSAADCENERNRASCFAYNNGCYSRVDGNVCPRITNGTDCAKSSRCRWQNNSCISLLEAGLSSQYTKSEGSPLPDCAFGGTCRDVNDLLRLALNYSKRLFGLLGVIGFVMFVYGGITMVLSFGSPEKFKQGQMALVAAIIGIVIALSAYLLVNFILNSVGATAEFRAIN